MYQIEQQKKKNDLDNEDKKSNDKEEAVKEQLYSEIKLKSIKFLVYSKADKIKNIIEKFELFLEIPTNFQEFQDYWREFSETNSVFEDL